MKERIKVDKIIRLYTSKIIDIEVKADGKFKKKI